MGKGIQAKGPSFGRLLREVQRFRARDLLPLIAGAAADQTAARLHNPDGLLLAGPALTLGLLAGLPER
jgi:hypothetical protein